MLVKATENNREEILNYCLEEEVFNIFIIGDIENFGFSSGIQDIWYEKEDDKIIGIVLRYHTTLIVYSKDLNMDFSSIRAITDNMNIENISGKSTVIDKLYPYLKGNYSRKDTKFCQYKDIGGLKDIKDDINVSDEKDAMEIAAAYGEISEFKALYSSDINIRYNQIFNRISTGEGKHVFIKDNLGILSHGNTTAENSHSAMIGGIFTRQNERRKGFGSQIVSYLVKDLINRKKNICLFYGNEEEGKFFMKLGFEIIGNWTVLRSEKDE
ncbi:GNAT family N-acetyltransferase [Tissierella sp. MB52-C2]|uniref:GNAT family N-acetyltransferase n=1 Tax=Tissierella sp. MB52-C2 TaxID=3070999 RepID=UPI00280AE37E|nr:GNAT family N-acetyltransferase [Tissierella sp. MB52-C2]WMM25888.1 GNAT family N-acetyltransferase [Tissierella sp. MB52-C2]